MSSPPAVISILKLLNGKMSDSRSIHTYVRRVFQLVASMIIYYDTTWKPQCSELGSHLSSTVSSKAASHLHIPSQVLLIISFTCREHEKSSYYHLAFVFHVWHHLPV